MSAGAHVDALALSDALRSLRDAITCPICEGVFKDPATLVCGHIFCFECINNAIENGVFREVRGGAGVEKVLVAEQKDSKRRGCKALTFCCPICEAAAYKWTIRKLPQLRNFLMSISEESVEK